MARASLRGRNLCLSLHRQGPGSGLHEILGKRTHFVDVPFCWSQHYAIASTTWAIWWSPGRPSRSMGSYSDPGVTAFLRDVPIRRTVQSGAAEYDVSDGIPRRRKPGLTGLPRRRSFTCGSSSNWSSASRSPRGAQVDTTRSRDHRAGASPRADAVHQAAGAPAATRRLLEWENSSCWRPPSSIR